MIFNKRWYGIKGETIEKGSKYAMSVVRVQTTKDGAWQALTDKELEQLLAEHNQVIYNNEAKVAKSRFDIKEQVKVLGADSLLPTSKKKTKKPAAKKKGKKK